MSASLVVTPFALPANGTATETIPAVTVTVYDQYDNVVVFLADSAVVSVFSGPGEATLSGTRTVAFVSGVAVFEDLALDKAGLYVLKVVTSITPGLANTSGVFEVTVGPPAGLVFEVAPGGGAASIAWAAGDQPVVHVVDAGGNGVASVGDGFTVTLECVNCSSVLGGDALAKPIQNPGLAVASWASLSYPEPEVIALRATTTLGAFSVISGDVVISNSNASAMAAGNDLPVVASAGSDIRKCVCLSCGWKKGGGGILLFGVAVGVPLMLSTVRILSFF